MAMENEEKHLENPHRTNQNDIIDDDDDSSSSLSSSPLASPSSSSSSPFCYDDQPDNPEHQSPIPESLSSPSNSRHKPSGYDPNRIPMSVFGSRSGRAPMEWSVASTESLFSIHVGGNGSFSRDHAMSLNKSGEIITKPEDWGAGSDAKRGGGIDRKSFSSTLAPVIEGAVDYEEKSEAFQVQESNNATPQNQEDVSKIAASKEIHSFAMKSNTSDGRGTRPASNPHHLSDDSGTSSSSFAFPVLVNEGANTTSLKSVPEKPESEQKPETETTEESQSQEEAESSTKESSSSSAAQSGWFPYLFCFRRCC